jgi:hypothetical protein
MNEQKWNDLDKFLREIVSDPEWMWIWDARLLIEAGMNLQALDTMLCQHFELKLGLTTKDDKIAAIAEFHRQVLELMGLPVPDRNIHPDPLALTEINEMPPFRGDISKLGNWYQFSDAEIAKLQSAMLAQRPELIRLIELSWQDWIKRGRPRRGQGHPTGDRLMASGCGPGMEAFILAERPDIGSMDAGHAESKIYDLYRIYSEE